jgi:hypothetical protein
MAFAPWIAMTAAFVVETLGMASISTAVRFWYHNQRYKKSTNKAPFGLAIGVYLFYLLVVMTVNVLLEIEAGLRSPTVIWTIGLFTSLSVPSGLLIAIRAQYSELLGNIKTTYKGSPAPGPQPEPQSGTMRRTKPASAYHDKILGMLEAEYGKSGQVLKPKQITSRLKLHHSNNKGYVSTLTKEWKQGKGI